MNVIVTLNRGLGESLGTLFTLTANVGGAPVPATATLEQLLEGLVVQVNNFATQITITSTGVCTNSITLNIVPPTTTTTSTTTSTTSTTTTTTTTTIGFNFYDAEIYDCTISTDCGLPTGFAKVKFPLGVGVVIGAYYTLDYFTWYKIISASASDVAVTLTGAFSQLPCPCSNPPTTTTTTTTTSTTTTSTSTTSTTTTSTTTTSTTTTTTTTSLACSTYTNDSGVNWVGEYQACDGTWYYNATLTNGQSVCAKIGTPFTYSGIDLTAGVSCTL